MAIITIGVIVTLALLVGVAHIVICVIYNACPECGQKLDNKKALHMCPEGTVFHIR